MGVQIFPQLKQTTTLKKMTKGTYGVIEDPARGDVLVYISFNGEYVILGFDIPNSYCKDSSAESWPVTIVPKGRTITIDVE